MEGFEVQTRLKLILLFFDVRFAGNNVKGLSMLR